MRRLGTGTWMRTRWEWTVFQIEEVLPRQNSMNSCLFYSCSGLTHFGPAEVTLLSMHCWLGCPLLQQRTVWMPIEWLPGRCITPLKRLNKERLEKCEKGSRPNQICAHWRTEQSCHCHWLRSGSQHRIGRLLCFPPLPLRCAAERRGETANPLKTHGPSVKSIKPQGHFIWFSSPDFVVTWAISKCGSGEDFISPAGHVGLPRTTE